MTWNELQNEWVATARTSDVGLWWLANDIRELLLGANEAEVREKCIEREGKELGTPTIGDIVWFIGAA